MIISQIAIAILKGQRLSDDEHSGFTTLIFKIGSWSFINLRVDIAIRLNTLLSGSTFANHLMNIFLRHPHRKICGAHDSLTMHCTTL